MRDLRVKASGEGDTGATVTEKVSVCSWRQLGHLPLAKTSILLATSTPGNASLTLYETVLSSARKANERVT